MKSHPATLLVATAVVSGGPGSRPQADAQTATGRDINPAAGLPTGPAKPAAVDPGTGLSLPAPLTAPPAPRDTSSMSLVDDAREAMGHDQFEKALQCYLSYTPRLQSAVRDAEQKCGP